MKKFQLTEQHVRLLRELSIEDCHGVEWGGPHADFKRPFGNGDMVGDMARILGIEPVETDDEEVHWPKGTTDAMVAIYSELAVALEIVLRTGSFTPGVYVTSDYGSDWKSDNQTNGATQ